MTAQRDLRNRGLRQLMTAMACLLSLITLAFGQQPDSATSRRLNLHDAVELALKHNHVVRIAALHVEEEQHAKEVARSAYLPTLRNDSNFRRSRTDHLIPCHSEQSEESAV